MLENKWIKKFLIFQTKPTLAPIYLIYKQADRMFIDEYIEGLN